MLTLPAEQPEAAAVVRLNALHRLDAKASAALKLALERPRKYGARRELLAEGEEITETLLILSGWAARMRILEDGRRQVVDFILPGELIGLCGHDRPVSTSTVIAITEVDACVPPDRSVSPALARSYALSKALEDAHLLAQITRLGRLSAHDRIADLLLELLERLKLAGLAANGRYMLPLTQEMVADALGLTSVHVNRTLQALRRAGSLNWKGRELVISDPEGLRRSTGSLPTRVTAG